MVRMPQGMRERLADEAKLTNRSMNAMVVHILQSYFEGIERQIDAHAHGEEAEKAEGISIGLHTPEDRAALIKSLLLSEVMLLKRRIADFGGREAVLAATKQEIAEAAGRDVITGTAGERRSLLSQSLPGYPLTSLFTDDELGKIAARVVLAQEAISGQRGKKP